MPGPRLKHHHVLRSRTAVEATGFSPWNRTRERSELPCCRRPWRRGPSKSAVGLMGWNAARRAQPAALDLPRWCYDCPTLETLRARRVPRQPEHRCGVRDVISVCGLVDLGLGAAKLGLGLVAAPETGGLSLYGAYSGLANLVSAGGYLYGGLSGNLQLERRQVRYPEYLPGQ